jgi:hypothetical protein
LLPDPAAYPSPNRQKVTVAREKSATFIGQLVQAGVHPRLKPSAGVGCRFTIKK